MSKFNFCRTSNFAVPLQNIAATVVYAPCKRGLNPICTGGAHNKRTPINDQNK